MILRNQPAQPLRVLHIITRMIVGGAQENAMLSCALIDQGHFPSEILSGVETGSEGELHSECRVRSVVLHFEPSLIRSVNPWKDLIALWRLGRFIRRGRYDVVHTHSSKAGILGRIAAWLARAPVVVHTVHGWSFNREQTKFVFWFYVTLERLCARLCRTLIVVGSPDRNQGLTLGIGKPQQYHLIRSGIEIDAYRDVALSRMEAAARIGVPADAFIVGSVGRLSPQKCPLDLLAAFERLAQVRDDAHLVLVGDGPQRSDIEAAVNSKGLSGRVHLLGLRRDVPAILRAFDVFVLSSRWEGLPRVFPQAMAASLPIVATRVDGAPDAVTVGENGWLVNVGDIAALSEYLIELGDDRETARRMGERGCARVDEFSARRMVQELEALYEKLSAEKVMRRESVNRHR